MMTALVVLILLVASYLAPFVLGPLCLYLDERIGSDTWRTRFVIALVVICGLLSVAPPVFQFMDKVSTLHAAVIYDTKTYCEIAWWDILTCWL